MRPCLLLALLLSGCVSVYSDFYDARSLPKGTDEITPFFSSTSFLEDESEHIQYNFGIVGGYGVRDDLDMRIAFAHTVSSFDVDEDVFHASTIALGPKWTLVPDKIAVSTPIGFAFGEGLSPKETLTFAPTALVTTALSSPVLLTPSAKVLLPITGRTRDVLLALNLGAAVSTNLDRWALRPEVGLLVNPGDSGYFVTFGAAYSFRL